jgi:hypothetical protein
MARRSEFREKLALLFLFAAAGPAAMIESQISAELGFVPPLRRRPAEWLRSFVMS